MYLANSPNGNLSDEPLWLVVQHGQRSRVFELASSGDNTVVFGASNEADVKFSGMVPVALYLERDAKGVWLTPGYADSTLRVDGQPLQSRRPIYGKAVLESSGIKIVLCVRDTPPTLRGGASRCDDTTVIPRPANWGSMASDTREYSREELAWLFSDDEGAALGIDEFDGWFDSNAISGGFEKRSVAELKPQPLEGQRVSAQTPPSVDLSKVQRCSGDTTEYDGAAFRRLLTPKAPPIVASVVDNAALAVVTSTLTPLPLMARIGVLAKKNPLRVFLGASLGSLFLVVFMVGAVNLASGGNKPKTERGAAPSVSHAAVPEVASVPQMVPSAVPAGSVQLVSGDAPSVLTIDDAGDPNIQVAVGHLFAGRYTEAEQAYRELAGKYPTNATYATVARVLARRNSKECQFVANAQKSCPTVKL